MGPCCDVVACSKLPARSFAHGGLGQHERERLERQIEAHGAAIDELVYRLYGLAADDIRIVEEPSAR